VVVELARTRVTAVASSPSVVVIGGGLAGIGAAFTLASAGVHDVTVVERGPQLGGLAGTFERDGHFYPLAYHHILHLDQALLYFLERIGALSRVRWRRVPMLFHQDGRFHDLSRVGDFLRFPMSLADKLRFARLMARCFFVDDWSEWHGRSATELVDRWGGPGVRRAIFEKLTRLKFDLSCDEVSAAWLGARLHQREGSAPLGYVPGANWTKVLCDGLAELLASSGVKVRTNATIRSLETSGERVVAAELEDGSRLAADQFVSTVPTPVWFGLVPRDETPDLASIRYTAVISAVCATRRKVEPDFYWLNLPSLDRTACGIFLLDTLNPSIGASGERCVNFTTHVQSRDRELFQRSDERLLADYAADFRAIFGHDLEPTWSHVSKLALYSPIFAKGYRNPPVRSATWRNVRFAGNFRTFPSIASTGTALGSGVLAASSLLDELGTKSDVPAAIRAFRLRSTPRGGAVRGP
jgi:protoporphyrinogen oxidase